MFGGELQGMTKNLADSRNEVMGRMLEHARAKGGNAVIGMRFDTSEMGDDLDRAVRLRHRGRRVPVTSAHGRLRAARLRPAWRARRSGARTRAGDHAAVGNRRARPDRASNPSAGYGRPLRQDSRP